MLFLIAIEMHRSIRARLLFECIIIVAMSITSGGNVELVARVGAERIGNFTAEFDVIAGEFTNLL